MGVAAIARPESLAAAPSEGRAEALDLEAVYAQHARYVAGVVHRIMG
jgi:hypothetical protein